MKNAPDAFERALRESLDSYEVPYNSADWSQMERELDKLSGVKRGTSTAMLALLISGGIALATTAYLVAVKPDFSGDAGTTLPANQNELVFADTEHSEAPLRIEAAQPEIPVAVEVPPPGQAPSENRQGPAANKEAAPSVARADNSASVLTSTPVKAPASEEVGILPSITETCPGGSIVFTVENAPVANEVKGLLWNFGDGSFSVERTPTHVFTKPGRYVVTLSYSTNTGSLIQKPISEPIIIHEVPKASFVNLAMGGAPEKVPYMHFEPKSPGAVSYLWDFGDGHTSKDRVATHVYKKKGTYTVTLHVENAIGCSDRTERSVKIEDDYNLLAPTAFSPNGDGVDDSFMPDALTMLNLRFHMRIHDPENGQLLFETNDPKRSWNGRVHGRGDPCPVGNYLWVVEMKDGEKVGGTYNGTVSLVR